MARLMRAHLLLTALLLSAHLFHAEARLAQGRRHASGGRGRVEAGPETDVDTILDAWDRRLLQDAPPSPPAVSAGGIVGIIIGISLLGIGAGLIGRVIKKKLAKKNSEGRAVKKNVDAALAKVQADEAWAKATPEERERARRRFTELSIGNLLFGPVDSSRIFLEKVDVDLKRRAPLPDAISAVEVRQEVRVQSAAQVVEESSAKNSYRGDAPNYLEEGSEGSVRYGSLVLEQSFDQSEADPRATATFNQDLMNEFKAEQLSPENKAKEKTVEKLTAEIKELQRQQNENIKATLAATKEIKRAATKGDKAAEDKAKKEKAALEEEKKTLDAKKEAASKKRREAERPERG